MRGLIERLRGRRPAPTRTRPPTGTVTFMLTDIESSTRLWENEPDAMERAIGRHGEIVAAAVARHNGTLVRERGEGDSTFSVFRSAPDALCAALDMQRAFVAERWPEGVALRVRTALNTGDARLVTDEYAAAPINRCARIREVAYGGQILLSEQTAGLAGSDLPANARLHDLGTHRLRDLSRPVRIYQLCHPEIPQDFPALRSLEAGLHNLPVQLTSFIGRESEINEVRKLLATTRMLNLTGTGGIGKTRLALHVAGTIVDAYPDGVWFVDLAPITDGELVPQAVSSALSLREEPGRSVTDAVLDHLRSAHALIVLDNTEHVADAATAFATSLLRSCVEVTVIATGREPLRVPGATTWRVPTMSVPREDEAVPAEAAADYEGVWLFCERAALHKPDFALTHDTAEVVARICRRLDGVPLAIELAAAAMSSLSPAEIEAKLGDRFRLLAGGGPDVPRHSTLEATVEWSHELLSPEERVLFRRLAVFAGGWTLEGAERVCSLEGIDERDVARVMTSLVDKSLVAAEEAGERTRFAMLETIRQYASSKLADSGEEISVRNAHLDYFCSFAAQATEHIDGPDEGVVLDSLEADHDNVRQALQHAIDKRSTDAIALATHAARFWSRRGYWSEGRAWLAKALATAGDADKGLRARALAADGALAQHQGDLLGAKALLAESLDLGRSAGATAIEPFVLLSLGNVLFNLGERADARLLFNESIDAARRQGDHRAELSALGALGVIALTGGDLAEAKRTYERCVVLARRLSARGLLATQLTNLGRAHLEANELEEARVRFEETRELAREIDDRSVLAEAMSSLGDVASRMDDYARATDLYAESLATYRELGDEVHVADALYRLGWAARMTGDYAKARDFLNESSAIWSARGVKQGVAAVAHELGVIKRAEGDLTGAEADLTASLRLAQELNYLLGVADCLEGLAAVAVDRSDAIRAAQLVGAADAIRDKIGATRAASTLRELDSVASGAAALIGFEGFDRARADGRALELDRAISLAVERA